MITLAELRYTSLIDGVREIESRQPPQWRALGYFVVYFSRLVAPSFCVYMFIYVYVLCLCINAAVYVQCWQGTVPTNNPSVLVIVPLHSLTLRLSIVRLQTTVNVKRSAYFLLFSSYNK